MRVSTIRKNNYFPCMPTREISFLGVELSDYKNKTRDIFNNSDIAEPNDRFRKGLKEIKEFTEMRKKQVAGFFKKRKLDAIQKEGDAKERGFLRAQAIFVDEENKVIQILKDSLELAKKENLSQDKIANLQNALLREQKIREKMAVVADNKNKQKGFDSIGGYEEEKFILTDNFINLLPLEMAGEDVEFPNSILFFGPTGNGKTTFAKAFAYSANCLFDEANPKIRTRDRAAFEQSFFEDLEEKAKIAQKNFLTQGVRTIILADEIDRFAYDDSSILPKLKRFLEECSDKYHVTVFATSNHPLKINSAIRGPKRMPIKTSIDPPDEVNAAEVFKYYLTTLYKDGLSDDIDYNELAKKICSVGPDRAFNNSQIEDICRNCYEENYGKINQNRLIYYIERETPGISRESMEKFNEEKRQLIGYSKDV